MTNLCIFIGNVGQTPKITEFSNGDKQASFSIGVTEKWKTKEGEQKELTTWVNVVANRGLAKVVENYVNKGSKLYIEGKLKNRSYDKNGETKYITEIVANNLTILSNSKGKDGQNEGEAYEPSQDAKNSPSGGLNDLDDDLPF